MACKDSYYNFCDIRGYEERLEEAIINLIVNIMVTIFISRCTKERDLDWSSNMESLSKKEWDRDSLTKEGKLILKEIKGHIIHILQWLKSSLKSSLHL